VLSAAATVVKTALVPGSMGLLLLGVLAGVASLYVPSLSRWARRWLVVLCLLYVALAMPVVASWLETGTRPTYPRIASPADARGATAVVVLGNGLVSYTYEGLAIESLTRRTAYNAIEAARLYRLIHPAVVIASGGLADVEVHRRSEGEALRDALVSLGVPRKATAVETQSSNTAEQAQLVAPLLRGHPRFLLVTTPIHMPRAVALFRSRGLDPVPAPSPIDYTRTAQGSLLRFVPSSNALRASELSMYEYLGIAYGRSRGWLDPARDAPQ
jgi:uncharacterized SAM-binding protein YcdF (DUF218 family)